MRILPLFLLINLPSYAGPRLRDGWRGWEEVFMVIWSCYWCSRVSIGSKCISLGFMDLFISLKFDTWPSLNLIIAGRSCYDWWWTQRWEAEVLVSLCSFYFFCYMFWNSEGLIIVMESLSAINLLIIVILILFIEVSFYVVLVARVIVYVQHQQKIYVLVQVSQFVKRLLSIWFSSWEMLKGMLKVLINQLYFSLCRHSFCLSIPL